MSRRARSRELTQIRAVLARHRELQDAAIVAAPQLWRGRAAHEQLAESWQHMGFTAPEVDEWLAAGCVLPFAAAGLRESYISSELAGRVTDKGDGPPATIGFKCATMQLGISEAKLALGISVEVINAERERELRERSARLGDARKAALGALQELEAVLLDGPVDPAAAAHAALAITAYPLQLANALSALANVTYRGLAHALYHEDLERHESAATAALALAEHLDALASDLRSLHAEHFQTLFGGTLNPNDFGLRLARDRDGNQPPDDQPPGRG